MNIDVKKAIMNFWEIRSGGKGVRSGKTMDSFVTLVKDVLDKSNLNDAKIYTKSSDAQLPGYFRPHKSWDIVVISNGNLVAAIEFKSQIGSIGNNFNNRAEEVLGSGLDLHTSIEEGAFGEGADIFTGYIILVEDSLVTRKNTSVTMKYFPVMKGFLSDESIRDVKYKMNEKGVFPKVASVSYLERYDLLCKRLVAKKIYTSAALILVETDENKVGEYSDFSPQTSIDTFLLKLKNHFDVISTY